MTDIIHLLPDVVANQIAAGEVIQRPASVIKELVENAVDAQAKRIDVQVIDAGRTSIQVVDDGKGMSETDARLSFERHATSKIRQSQDLFSLTTMGFRGEALASIAAVSQTELITRRAEDELGTQISIAASKVVKQQLCACPAGSNFIVKNLFYNVPARRKFLKSNATELHHIIIALQRIALVYPDIAFTLRHNDTEIMKLGSVGLKQRIVDIFGKKISPELLPVKVETSICSISGFIGKPESARKKENNQYFFVNGRYMKHPYFHKAVMTAFERLVPPSMQIQYYLYFEVKPEQIDVNIHPTKTEIKFENEQEVWQILHASIKESLGLFTTTATIDFDTEGMPDIPVFTNRQDITFNDEDSKKTYDPFAKMAHSQVQNFKRERGAWEELYEGIGNQETLPSKDLFADLIDEAEPNVQSIAEKSPVHYQYKGQYILTAVKSGLMIIHQHRAHFRILYEEYLNRNLNKQVVSQKMLFPEMLQVTAVEEVILKNTIEQLGKLGFEISDMGQRNYAINAVPIHLEKVNVIELIRQILSEGIKPQDKHKTIEKMAMTMAKYAAIQKGEVLDNAEMENLVNHLFMCKEINYTPEGKRILHILEDKDIEHYFA